MYYTATPGRFQDKNIESIAAGIRRVSTVSAGNVWQTLFSVCKVVRISLETGKRLWYDAGMNENCGENSIPRRSELLWACALLAAGIAVRTAALGALPLGLNQDEASAGYDAWAILTAGMDRCGNRLPVLLEAWGSGQNALLSYLSLPFLALFGLSPLTLRIVPALFGAGTLAVFWRLARRTRGQLFGLCALFFLALNPWHIMACRWALESNLLPALLLGGVFFAVRAREKPWSLLPAAVCFGLAPYAYGTAFLFLPAFLIFAVVWLRKRLRPAPFLVSLGVFVLLVFPIALCQLRNALGLPAATLLGFTLPALTETRQAATTVLGGGGFPAAWSNFRAFLRLLVTQSDGLPYNAIPAGGIFYVFGLPLAVWGLVKCVLSLRSTPEEAPVLAALLCCLPAAFLTEGNINRLNMFWLPLAYFASLGLWELARLLRRWSAVPFAAAALCFALFFTAYIREFGGEGYSGNFPGLGSAIEYVAERDPDSAYISYYVNQPYIFALFYTRTPPQEFLDTVDYINPDGAFRWVRSFGYWRFGPAAEAEGQYLILHVSEAEGRTVLARFGQYVVCAG